MKSRKHERTVALSIRQPWATLIVMGLKTIEIRRWRSHRTGLIYVHAGQAIDRRSEAWRHLPLSYWDMAKQRGGIIGQVEMVACKRYESRQSFALDASKHLNNPHWFQRPALHGFVFERPQPLPFQRMKGELHFFEIDLESAVDPRRADGKREIIGELFP